MQWWGALTKQFTELAAKTLKESPVDAAGQAFQAAVGAAAKPASPARRAKAAPPRRATKPAR